MTSTTTSRSLNFHHAQSQKRLKTFKTQRFEENLYAKMFAQKFLRQKCSLGCSEKLQINTELQNAKLC